MNRKTAGFTLIELVVVFVIIGIFSSMAAPTFTQFLSRNRMDHAAQVVMTRLQEGLSVARATREVRIVQGNAATNSVQAYRCPQVVDPLTETIECAANLCERVATELLGEPDGDDAARWGSFIDLKTDFDVRYFPPHGDVLIADPSSAPGLNCESGFATLPNVTIELENDLGTNALKVHGVSGLVEPIAEGAPSPNPS